MKLALILLALALVLPALAAENSILFPRQIQPRAVPKTLRERCLEAKQWRRYGSLQQCMLEKRDEDQVEAQTAIHAHLDEVEERQSEQAELDRAHREAEREWRGWQMLDETLRTR